MSTTDRKRDVHIMLLCFLATSLELYAISDAKNVLFSDDVSLVEVCVEIASALVFTAYALRRVARCDTDKSAWIFLTLAGLALAPLYDLSIADTKTFLRGGRRSVIAQPRTTVLQIYSEGIAAALVALFAAFQAVRTQATRMRDARLVLLSFLATSLALHAAADAKCAALPEHVWVAEALVELALSAVAPFFVMRAVQQSNTDAGAWICLTVCGLFVGPLFDLAIGDTTAVLRNNPRSLAPEETSANATVSGSTWIWLYTEVVLAALAAGWAIFYVVDTEEKNESDTSAYRWNVHLFVSSSVYSARVLSSKTTGKEDEPDTDRSEE